MQLNKLSLITLVSGAIILFGSGSGVTGQILRPILTSPPPITVPMTGGIPSIGGTRPDVIGRPDLGGFPVLRRGFHAHR